MWPKIAAQSSSVMRLMLGISVELGQPTQRSEAAHAWQFYLQCHQIRIQLLDSTQRRFSVSGYPHDFHFWIARHRIAQHSANHGRIIHNQYSCGAHSFGFSGCL